MSIKHHTIRSFCIVLITALLSAGPVCAGDFSGDFLLFPQLDLIKRANLDSKSVLDRDHEEAAANIFATADINDFRFLGEFLLTTEEQEFERFQLGWAHKGQTYWLGLFHNPLGYWNISYHHGAFLQTSITRPSVIEFEDRGGIMPIHQAGLLAEGTLDFSQQEWGYSLALATGPEYDGGRLIHWDVLNPNQGSHDTSVTLNIHRDAGPGSLGRVGLFANYSRIPGSAAGIDSIHLTSMGFYGLWELSKWRWHGSAYFIRNRIERPAETEQGSFLNAFLQAEYNPDLHWTLYGRVEQTAGNGDDPYLALFPEFIEDRLLGGVRYDFNRSNALKFELSTNHARDDHFAQFMLQWSAMF